GAGSLLTPGGNFNAFDATTGKILWTWGIPNDTFISPSVTYMYKGKQYIAIYHGLALAGFPGATPSGQRDQLTVRSPYAQRPRRLRTALEAHANRRVEERGACPLAGEAVSALHRQLEERVLRVAGQAALPVQPLLQGRRSPLEGALLRSLLRIPRAAARGNES